MEWKKEKLREIWKLSKEKVIFLFCSGLLLFILSLPSESDSVVTGRVPEQGWEAMDAATGVSAAGTKTSGNGMTYEADLEMRIRDILLEVEGVGEVDVMLVLKSSEERTVHTGFSEKSVYPELSGIVISADGGGSALVKTEISEAMEALFGLPPHKIKVLKRVKKGV